MDNVDSKMMEKYKGDEEPAENWPKNASIDLMNVSARYRKGLPLVIKNLTFSIKDKEKIGIVGRTGSGKSTLLLLLTRLLEIENPSKESFICFGD